LVFSGRAGRAPDERFSEVWTQAIRQKRSIFVVLKT
jgi:hypothetical protein